MDEVKNTHSLGPYDTLHMAITYITFKIKILILKDFAASIFSHFLRVTSFFSSKKWVAHAADTLIYYF